MTDFSSVISPGNLKFGTLRATGITVKGLPEMYFLDDASRFARISPWHENGFTIIERKRRFIFFLTDEEYENALYNTGKELCKNVPKENLYDGAQFRKGDSYNVVSYSDPSEKPYRGYYAITPRKLRKIYKNLKINLDSLIAYCAENTEENNNAYIGESKDDIIHMLQEGFPLHA